MYLNYWGLRESPFHRPRQNRWFFEGDVHEEAVARLHFMIEHRHRLGILSGDMGSGKSLLLAVMADRLRRNGRTVVHASLEEASAAELWWILAVGLELNPQSHEPPPRLWRRVCDRLSHDRLTGNGTVLLLDDADQAHHDALAGILRLLSVEPLVGMQLSVVLACRPAGVSRLSARLVEQAELLITLEPFSLSETRDYVQEALTQAGREESAFSSAALLRLHELSDGVVRRINHLADLSLAAGASQGQEFIDTEIVEGVYQELGAAQLARRIA